MIFKVFTATNGIMVSLSDRGAPELTASHGARACRRLAVLPGDERYAWDGLTSFEGYGQSAVPDHVIHAVDAAMGEAMKHFNIQDRSGRPT